MTSYRMAAAAFGASLTLHALAGYALSLPVGPDKPPSETIEIDYVRFEKPREIVAAASHASRPAPLQKIKGIPVPRIAEPAPSDFQKIVDEKIRQQLKQIKRLEHAETPVRVSSSMTSAELIADPSKGKVFLDYFGQVKAKIQSTVHRAAGHQAFGQGSVCLAFVLNARGTLERLSVVDNGTTADAATRDLAKDCLQRSAPFKPFPKNLGPNRVVFNITIFFDGPAE